VCRPIVPNTEKKTRRKRLWRKSHHNLIVDSNLPYRMNKEAMPEDRNDVNRDSERFRKLFVGGLHFESTGETLRRHFETWGEVVDSVVIKDSVTHRSRGFGFVTFKRAQMLDDAQKARPHRIDGIEVETKRAIPREDAGRPETHLVREKIYVSGIREEMDEDDLRQYFSQYGTVEQVEVIVDKNTGNKRGFAFVSFEDYDPVDKIVLIKHHMIKDFCCDVKKAMTKEEMRRVRGGGDFKMGRGARGMPRGGMDRRGDYYDDYRRGNDFYLPRVEGFRGGRGGAPMGTKESGYSRGGYRGSRGGAYSSRGAPFVRGFRGGGDPSGRPGRMGDDRETRGGKYVPPHRRNNSRSQDSDPVTGGQRGSESTRGSDSGPFLRTTT